MFVLKRLLEAAPASLRVEIFEAGGRLGQGMPYSEEGATREHITNVSANELPDLPSPLHHWVRSLPQSVLDEYGIQRASFDEEKVLPRLLFGRYLHETFAALIARAREAALPVEVHYHCRVVDLCDLPEKAALEVVTEHGERLEFDQVVICTGHRWPHEDDDPSSGYFSSPYPPAKIARRMNHPVALRGSSLTAVDAIRTLARHNGSFGRSPSGELGFERDPESPDFAVIMHSRNGLLPCVRFHLEDPQVVGVDLLGKDDYRAIRRENDGFVPLDAVFESDFKAQIRERDPVLYERIQEMTLEQFVEAAMRSRERQEPFALFRAEYQEGRRSVALDRPIPWKEAISILSFSMNYPAKYFSAEDMLRLKQTLAPLIAVVIAFLPHGACEELLALHDAGALDLVEVGAESRVERQEGGGIVYYYGDDASPAARPFATFVDCVGQPALAWDELPFPTLLSQGVFSQATVRFRDSRQGEIHAKGQPDDVRREPDGGLRLLLPGVAIDDAFRPLDSQGRPHSRVQLMAVPYMGGHNPDYSGVDFCEEASQRIVAAMLGRAAIPR